jgi:polyisoprenoid-binding protein YceI
MGGEILSILRDPLVTLLIHSAPRNPNVTENILAIDSSHQYCIRGLTKGLPLRHTDHVEKAMQRPSRYSIATVVTALLGTSAIASAALSKPSESNVKFTASGPAGLKIEGKTNELDLAEDGGNVVVTVRLANLDTGIAIRDKHTKDCLEVEKYPDTKLSVAKSALKLPTNGEKASGDAPGTLKLHGKDVPTSVHYDVKADGSAFVVDGKLRINIKDAAIVAPSYMGITVKPDVDVDVHFRVNGT